MNKEKIVDYLDKQFWKHKKYECMPENETGYEYVSRETLSKIVDGLIPMVKAELKNSSMPDVSGHSEQKNKISLSKEEIEQAANDDYNKQIKYNDGYDRKKGFKAGVIWVMSLLK